MTKIEAEIEMGVRKDAQFGYTDNMLDVQVGRLYDSVEYATGATITTYNCLLFQNVGSASGKTIVETNMECPGHLPQPSSFLIERIIFRFSSECPDFIVRHFIERVSFILTVGSKNYFRTPLIALPHRGTDQPLAPLKCCESCGSCFVGLKCESCGAPEWRYLQHGGSPVGEQDDSHGTTLVMDVSGSKMWLAPGLYFRGQFEMMPYTLPTSGSGFKGFKFWVIMEGWHARAIQ